MKLYDRFGAKGFHSSFITTFGIDFDTYKNVCLNRLRGAGCTNNFILDLGQPIMDEYSAVLNLYPFLPPRGRGLS